MKRHALLMLLALLVPVGAGAQDATQRLVVRVLDSAGMPVPGLRTTDVSLTERGSARKVTWLSPAIDPVRILLLIDNSQAVSASLTDVRNGIEAFLDALPFPHEVSLITIGGTPVIRQVATTDREVVKGLARKLSAGGGLVLLGAVSEMYDRFLKKASDRWPMVVVIAGDGRDDTRGASEEKFVALARDMQSKDAIVHAVIISPNGLGSGESVQIARALTQATGGVYESISAASALSEKMGSLARHISSQYHQVSTQYMLDYISDSTDPNADLKLSVARDGVRVTLSRQGRIR